MLRQRRLVPKYVLCRMVAMVYCKKRSAKIISILGIFVNATLFITSCLILQSFYNPTYTLLKNTRFPLLLKYFDWLLGMSVTFSLFGIFMNFSLYYGLKKNRRIFMFPWISWTLAKLVVSLSAYQHFNPPSCQSYMYFRLQLWLASVNLWQHVCPDPSVLIHVNYFSIH